MVASPPEVMASPSRLAFASMTAHWKFSFFPPNQGLLGTFSLVEAAPVELAFPGKVTIEATNTEQPGAPRPARLMLVRAAPMMRAQGALLAAFPRFTAKLALTFGVPVAEIAGVALAPPEQLA